MPKSTYGTKNDHLAANKSMHLCLQEDSINIEAQICLHPRHDQNETSHWARAQKKTIDDRNQLCNLLCRIYCVVSW
jgi:hypothetical protein